MSVFRKLYYKLVKEFSKDGYLKILKEQGLVCGTNCEIYSTAQFGSEPYLITLGNNVRITKGVKFITHDGGIWVLRNMYPEEMQDKDFFGSIVVGDNVHIGWDTIIMPGVKIGNNVVVGCNSVVTKDIPDNSVAVGVPAKVIKSIDEYYINKRDECVPTKRMDSRQKKEYLLDRT